MSRPVGDCPFDGTEQAPTQDHWEDRNQGGGEFMIDCTGPCKKQIRFELKHWLNTCANCGQVSKYENGLQVVL